MGWISEDGTHEGYLVPQFVDGQRGRGVTGGSIPDGQVAVGDLFQTTDGSWEYPTRSAGEVTGWVVCCDCSSATSLGSERSWLGPVFTRVPSKALEDLAARRIFAPDEDVAYAGHRDDVAEAASQLWHVEHAFAVDALQEVAAAAAAAATARERLDDAAAFARHGGASWADIGRAAGMTRQSAQERWRRADGSGDVG